MTKTRFSMVAVVWVSGAAGLLLSGAGCGSSSSGGGTGGAGGVHDGGGGSGGGGTGGAHDGGGGTGDAHDGAVGDLATDSAAGSISYTFNTGTDGFMIDTFAGTNPFNLGGGVPAGGTAPTLTFDSTTGMPAAGSLHLTVTFTDYAQVVMVKVDYQNGSLLNLTGKTLTAEIRLDGAAPPSDAGATDAATSTTSSSFTGVAHLFVLTTPVAIPPATGSFFLGQGTSANLLDNNWHALTFDMAHPEYMAPGYDPTQIAQLGLQLASPAPPAADGGGTPFGIPQSISIHFDTLVSN